MASHLTQSKSPYNGLQQPLHSDIFLTLLPNFISMTHFSDSALATLASLLFLEYAIYAPTAGPLHLLFSLSEFLFHKIFL